MEINQFISTLHQSKQQAIIWHHQTTSFSEHKALQNYYDEILERIDGLVESIQGIYPRIESYTLSNPVDWTEGGSTIYFKGLYEYVQKERTTIYQDTWVQNQVDEIAAQIGKLLYLLSLK
jgi:hypothetical protein